MDLWTSNSRKVYFHFLWFWLNFYIEDTGNTRKIYFIIYQTLVQLFVWGMEFFLSSNVEFLSIWRKSRRTEWENIWLINIEMRNVDVANRLLWQHTTKCWRMVNQISGWSVKWNIGDQRSFSIREVLSSLVVINGNISIPIYFGLLLVISIIHRVDTFRI